jgi:sugar phosphate permease
MGHIESKPALDSGSRPSGNHRVVEPTRVRYVVLAVACWLAVLTYVNRLGFSVAAPEIKGGLGLNDEDMGYLAAAFLVAYGLCQVPDGLLGDRFGGRTLLTVLVLGWSLLSGATALATLLPATAAFLFLLALRFFFGVFQSAEFPSLARVIADWMPVQERGTAQGLIWTFSRLGGALVPFLFAGLLALFKTWTTPFWVMAGLGVMWCLVFWPWFRNQPQEMVRVNSAECALISSGRALSAATSAHVPWSTLVGSANVWMLCLMYGFVGFAGNFFTSMLPLYLKDHRHLSNSETALLSALPLGCGIASCLLGGVLSDWIIRRWGSRKWGRRLNGAVGLALAGLATLSTPWVEPVWLLAIVLSLAFFFNDLNMGPAWAACADVGERYAGTISGAMNMVGAFAGAAGMALVGYLLRRGEIKLLFVVFAVSYALASLSWLGINVARPLGARLPLTGERPQPAGHAAATEVEV